MTDTLQVPAPGLGAVDFSVVEDFELLPAGRYPGQTEGKWEPQLAKNQKTTNMNVKVSFQYEKAVVDDDGEPTNETEIKTRPATVRYNNHPDALFRVKRDLINLGADPVLLKSKQVNLKDMLDQYFGGDRRSPIWVHLIQRPFTPEGSDEAEMRNEIAKIELRVPEAE